MTEPLFNLDDEKTQAFIERVSLAITPALPLAIGAVGAALTMGAMFDGSGMAMLAGVGGALAIGQYHHAVYANTLAEQLDDMSLTNQDAGRSSGFVDRLKGKLALSPANLATLGLAAGTYAAASVVNVVSNPGAATLGGIVAAGTALAALTRQRYRSKTGEIDVAMSEEFHDPFAIASKDRFNTRAPDPGPPRLAL